MVGRDKWTPTIKLDECLWLGCYVTISPIWCWSQESQLNLSSALKTICPSIVNTCMMKWQQLFIQLHKQMHIAVINYEQRGAQRTLGRRLKWMHVTSDQINPPTMNGRELRDGAPMKLVEQSEYQILKVVFTRQSPYKQYNTKFTFQLEQFTITTTPRI